MLHSLYLVLRNCWDNWKVDFNDRLSVALERVFFHGDSSLILRLQRWLDTRLLSHTTKKFPHQSPIHIFNLSKIFQNPGTQTSVLENSQHTWNMNISHSHFIVAINY